MPIPTKNKSFTGMRGKAEVRVLSDQLRVIFPDGDTYSVKKDGWDTERPSGTYNVTLTKTNDEIKFLAPPGRDEPYLVKFLEYANRVGRTDDDPGVPEQKIREGGWRQGPRGSYFEEDKLIATAKFIVVEKGPFNGLTITYEIPYIFAQYPGTMISMLEGTAAQRKKVETFLTLTGFDMVNDEIPWAGNVLPFLEPKQQLLGKIFAVRLNENGFVAKDGLSAIPSYLIPTDLLAAKPAKKVKSNGKANGKVVSKKAKARK